MKLAHLRSFFTSMDGKSMFLLLRQFQGIYKEKSVGHFPELLEPTHMLVNPLVADRLFVFQGASPANLFRTPLLFETSFNFPPGLSGNARFDFFTPSGKCLSVLCSAFYFGSFRRVSVQIHK